MPTKTPRHDWKQNYGFKLATICAWLARRDAAGKCHWESCRIASGRFNGRRLRKHHGKRLKLSVLSVYKHFRKYQVHGAAALAPRYCGPKRPSIPIPARCFVFRCVLSGKRNSLGVAARHVVSRSGGNISISDCYKLLTPEQKFRLKEIQVTRRRIISAERKLLAEFKAKLPRIPRQKSPAIKSAPGRAGISVGIQPAFVACNQNATVCPSTATHPGECGQDGKNRAEATP